MILSSGAQCLSTTTMDYGNSVHVKHRGPAGKGDLRGSVQKWVPQNSDFIRENDEIYDEIYDEIL